MKARAQNAVANEDVDVDAPDNRGARACWEEVRSASLVEEGEAVRSRIEEGNFDY